MFKMFEVEEKRNLHNFFLGKIGSAQKSITFSEKEFKKELAPKNAIIEYGELDGEKVVKMTYRY